MSELLYTTLKSEYVEQVHKLQQAVFPTVDPKDQYQIADLNHHARTFPDGMVVVLDGARAVGYGMGLLTDFDFNRPQHRIEEVMGDEQHSNHNPNGLYYYGTDIGVHPDYRRHGIGRNIYEWRKNMVRRLNKRGIVAGGVLPGYKDHASALSPQEYIAQVVDGKLYDRTLTFQLQNGFMVRGVLENYFPHPESRGFASLIYWENPDYRPMARSFYVPQRRPLRSPAFPTPPAFPLGVARHALWDERMRTGSAL